MRDLTIHDRKSVRADGTDDQLAVDCPRRHAAVPVETCVLCERCHGITINLTGRQSTLRCDVPDEQAACAGGAVDTPVRAIMQGDVLCVGPDLSVHELLVLLVERGISGAPVVDENGAPIGVVSRSDLVREDYQRAGGEGIQPRLGAPAHTSVREIMTPIPFTLPEEASIADAARLMADAGVHRVPVVSRGRCVGIVSSLDVLRWLAKNALPSPR
jgi:CBS domain-containing protein